MIKLTKDIKKHFTNEEKLLQRRRNWRGRELFDLAVSSGALIREGGNHPQVIQLDERSIALPFRGNGTLATGTAMRIVREILAFRVRNRLLRPDD